MAKIVKKRETTLLGIVLEITGVIFILFGIPQFMERSLTPGPLQRELGLMWTPYGGFVWVLVGVLLMGIGYSKSRISACSECRNSVEKNEVKICPTCKVEFE